MNRGIFVTGTDTGVGKTVASCALVRALRSRGVGVHPFKPIAAGGIEDTLALIDSAGLDASAVERVTPILLREPMAPHIAAAREGRALSIGEVRAAYDRIADSFVVAEGVGGFKVPLGEGIDTVDLCRALELPVVMVVGMRLGCLNHALLTAQAIASAGLPFAGWIANNIDPGMMVSAENVAALASRLPAPLLGRLPFSEPFDPLALARYLDVSPLLAAP